MAASCRRRRAGTAARRPDYSKLNVADVFALSPEAPLELLRRPEHQVVFNRAIAEEAPKAGAGIGRSIMRLYDPDGTRPAYAAAGSDARSARLCPRLW